MKLALDPFDRSVLGIVLCLIAIIAGLLLLGDHVGAAVLGAAPTAADHPAVTTAIRITFAQPMDTASVEAHFAVEPPVGGHSHWDGNTFVFQPNRPLLPNTPYTLTLTADTLSLTGQRTLQSAHWTISPRQPRVLYLPQAGSSPLWSVAADGSGAHELFTAPSGLQSFAPSPDGGQVALSVLGEGSRADLWLMNADGSGAHRALDCAPAICTNPTWSPDGKLLAYERQEMAPTGQLGLNRVWLFDPASGETAPAVPDSQMLGFQPQWSPDGARLAAYDPSVAGIRVVERASGQSVVIPTWTGLMGSFAADGKAMVYSDAAPNDASDRTQLWIQWLDKADARAPLLNQSADDRSPSWSPDGAWIAFARRPLAPETRGGGQLALYHVETGKVRQVTQDAEADYSDFQWDPNSRRILMQRIGLKSSQTGTEWWTYDLNGEKLSHLVDGLQARWIP
ncbi:MAG TPA: Ig-like domain-containing protein [Chloroflexota bacterium]|nr:Ig-like domain-containing protein [Chloroflexota bacterium]